MESGQSTVIIDLLNSGALKLHRTFISLALIATVSACGNNREFSYSPYGTWSDDNGTTITISPSGKYSVCREKSCSAGEAEIGQHSRLSVVLRGFFSKGEASRLAKDYGRCVAVNWQGSETARMVGSIDDFDFSPLQSTGGGPIPSRVRYDDSCELGEISLTKTSEIEDPLSQQQLNTEQLRRQTS